MFHLISINCRYSHSCLAQFYVRNELEHHFPDFPVVLSLFTINDPYYYTLLQITEKKARAIFFSVYIWNHIYVRRLIDDLSRLLPDLPIILGGPQAMALDGLPEQCVVVKGEIEGIGEHFYRDLAAGRLLPQYQARERGSFPSPYRPQDFNGPLKNRQLYYESSRGCPFSCSYCLSSIVKGVRHKPFVQVKQELRQLIAAQPMIIKFVDRTFNDDPGRAFAIWQFLIEEARGVKYHFEIAPDRFSEKMFDLLATAPSDLFQFEIGIQSCNQQTLAAVKRRMDLKRAGENIQRLVALDTIHLHVDLILGLPFETRESFQQSFNRVFRFAPHYIQLGLLKVLPGTEMARRVVEFGLVFCGKPPYEVLATRWLDHDELRDLYEFCEMVESFYNNRFFRSLWQYIRLSGEEPFAFFSRLLDCCRCQGFFQMARTQKLMNRILFECVHERRDGNLLLELMCYDWLRCGYRSLPKYFAAEEQTDLRNRLRRQLPQNLEGVYDYRSRTEFFKQSAFLELSSEAMQILGPGGSSSAVVAFLSGQDGGVIKYSKVLTVRGEGSEHEQD